MKKPISVLAAVAALSLSACASAPEPRAPTVIDHDYVGAVEAQARQAGVEVFWVNPPRKPRHGEDQG